MTVDRPDLDTETIRQTWHDSKGKRGAEYLLALCSEVERLRSERDLWRNLTEQAADDGVGICDCGRCYLDGPEQYAAVVAERDLYWDAIRQHRAAAVENPWCVKVAHCGCWGCEVVADANDHLWSALDSGGVA